MFPCEFSMRAKISIMFKKEAQIHSKNSKFCVNFKRGCAKNDTQTKNY